MNKETSNSLLSVLERFNSREKTTLSPHASFSVDGLRRFEDDQQGYRQHYAMDADRILHSRAYTRYIDKTQVFCLVENDHITHRVLHVQLVSRIARTIGRFLHLNEDLLEAISLGHDIGHPPFGHAGEHFLSELCQEHELPPFQHNIQSVRFLDQLEKKGKGWNLTVQTLDGILCHDGEVHSRSLSPLKQPTWQQFDSKMLKKEANPDYTLIPSTLEGCVVRLADTIAYIGRDIEDAITLGLVVRDDIPQNCSELLGATNGTIVYNLVTDLLHNSRVVRPGEDTETSSFIGFSKDISEALRELKQFNYERIYLAPDTKKDLPLIGACYRKLFQYYLDHLSNRSGDSELEVDLMTDITHRQGTDTPPAMLVRDFIAGMTDDFFLHQAAEIGCTVPVKR